LLQDAWQEEQIIYDLTAAWEKGVKVIISNYGNESFAMGSIRECNPLGKQVLLYFCKELTFL
jgi:hypothetical protein